MTKVRNVGGVGVPDHPRPLGGRRITPPAVLAEVAESVGWMTRRRRSCQRGWPGRPDSFVWRRCAALHAAEGELYSEALADAAQAAGLAMI
jgi:hypothetical protein